MASGITAGLSRAALPRPQVCSRAIHVLVLLQHAAGMVGRCISDMDGRLTVRAADHEDTQLFPILDVETFAIEFV